VNAIPKPGFSSGDAIKAIEEVAAQQLPAGYSYEFSGQTREEISSGGQSTTIFLLCLIFIYFLLAAQYESYILPLAVIFSIPAGIFGVFVAIGLTGIENNIYVQVALVCSPRMQFLLWNLPSKNENPARHWSKLP
jgi:HAE1 family hydrophobic/amphiphilic exporter-1